MHRENIIHRDIKPENLLLNNVNILFKLDLLKARRFRMCCFRKWSPYNYCRMLCLYKSITILEQPLRLEDRFMVRRNTSIRTFNWKTTFLG